MKKKNNVLVKISFDYIQFACPMRNETKGSVLFIKSTRNLKEMGNIKNNYTRNLSSLHSSRNREEEGRNRDIVFHQQTIKEFNIENGG